MKSGNLNFLEPSGPLQACNGAYLPLPILELFSWHILAGLKLGITITFHRFIYI
jgi:hypothetical protein